MSPYSVLLIGNWVPWALVKSSAVNWEYCAISDVTLVCGILNVFILTSRQVSVSHLVLLSSVQTALLLMSIRLTSSVTSVCSICERSLLTSRTASWLTDSVSSNTLMPHCVATTTSGAVLIPMRRRGEEGRYKKHLLLHTRMY